MTNRFVDATQELEPSKLQPVIGSHWGFYTAVLHHHHHTEDDSIYPALLVRRPDLKTLVDTLAEDHRHLVGSIDIANAAVTAFEQEPDAANQKSMHEAIVAVRDAFFPHLDVEDAQIIPAITESMPPKEWDRLDKQALRTIPRQCLPIAVGGLDEVIQGLPEQERPPPPPLPIRLMLALSWRKKWAAWVEPLLV
jgi:hemerythrin-like domain-containing protein